MGEAGAARNGTVPQTGSLVSHFGLVIR